MFRSILVVFLLISSSLSLAQRRPGPMGRSGGVEVSVRVVYENSRPAGEQLRVQLTNQTGATFGETYTDSRGEVRFSGIRPGTYRVKVSGIGIQDSASDTFVVDPLDVTSFQIVTVQRTQEAVAAEKAAAPISAAELNIPGKARREFDKGKELFDKGKNDEAVQRFTKATEIYPQYAAAFDMLGVIASQASPADAKTYFQQALSADKSYIPAAAHLAKVYVGEKNFSDAEPLLTRTLAISPQAAEALFLLAYVQAKLTKYEDAIRTTDRLHQLDHRDLALVHFVAAECYTSLKRPEEAVAQYEMYLKEAPLGPSVDIAKNNISVLQAQLVAK
jgi:tetratricopeptide (TPR) repeat protein